MKQDSHADSRKPSSAGDHGLARATVVAVGASGLGDVPAPLNVIEALASCQEIVLTSDDAVKTSTILVIHTTST